MWDMTRLHVRHDSFTCETWLVHMWDMTRLYVRHDSFTGETWLENYLALHLNSTHVTQPLEGKLSVVSFICVPCIIRNWLCTTLPNYNCTQLFVSFHTWDMTRLHVRHDSFTCETWLVYIWNMTRLHVRHDSFTCETQLVCMWDMTRLHVRHDLFTCKTWLNNYLSLHLNNTEYACDSDVGT